MTPLTVIVILIFFASVFFSRSRERRAFWKLSDDQRRAVSVAHPGGVSSLFAVVAGILVYVLAKKNWPDSHLPALGFVLFLVVYYGVLSLLHLKTLKKEGVDAAYIKSLALGRGVQAVTLLVLFAVLLSSTFGR